MNKLENRHLLRVPYIPILVGRTDIILEKSKNKTVLHLGCVDEGFTIERFKQGTLLHAKLMEVAKEVYGIDISEEGINFLRNMGISNLFVGNIENIDTISSLRGRHFDIIVCTEVLEHIANPGLFLQNIKDLITKDTQMIITVPNGLRLTGTYLKYRGFEFVHPDHNYWFSFSTVKSLLEKNEYQILETFAYTFFNHNASIKTSFTRRITKMIGKRLSIKRLQTKFRNSDRDSENIPYFTIRWALEILLRRSLYKKRKILFLPMD